MTGGWRGLLEWLGIFWPASPVFGCVDVYVLPVGTVDVYDGAVGTVDSTELAVGTVTTNEVSCP